MASRAVNYWRSALSRIGAYRQFTTLTVPKAKAATYGRTASGFAGHQQTKPRKALKGDFVPVYVALGLITLSVSLGLYTAEHQLAYSPNVFLRKKKRETVPEVYDPDYVVYEADKFVKKSFFRKLGHIQDIDRITDPILAERPRTLETLKSAGVEPSLQGH